LIEHRGNGVLFNATWRLSDFDALVDDAHAAAANLADDLVSPICRRSPRLIPSSRGRDPCRHFAWPVQQPQAISTAAFIRQVWMRQQRISILGDTSFQVGQIALKMSASRRRGDAAKQVESIFVSRFFTRSLAFPTSPARLSTPQPQHPHGPRRSIHPQPTSSKGSPSM
jgi:hypothetical protein